MSTIWNAEARKDLVNRINSLSADTSNAWGKMNVFQMLRHCALSEEMILGKKKYDRLFMGRLFGAMALKMATHPTHLMKKNLPTHPVLKIKENGSVENEKHKWIALINEYASFSNPNFVHPFFGKMTDEQIGTYVYKHSDHHLRQFGR